MKLLLEKGSQSLLLLAHFISSSPLHFGFGKTKEERNSTSMAAGGLYRSKIKIIQIRVSTTCGRLKGLFLTPIDSFAENIVVLAVVVPELELSDVERHVLGTDFVERA